MLVFLTFYMKKMLIQEKMSLLNYFYWKDIMWRHFLFSSLLFWMKKRLNQLKNITYFFIINLKWLNKKMLLFTYFYCKILKILIILIIYKIYIWKNVNQKKMFHFLYFYGKRINLENIYFNTYVYTKKMLIQ